MGKNKLKRWAEINNYWHVFQPDFDDVFKKDFHLKNKWNSSFFKNNNPIILELGCGRGEYTTGLARKYPDKNFIGIDIKGARLWKGAREASLENLRNVAFIRSEIEVISSFFGKDEIEEIWITFPDPQLKQSRAKKRLTGTLFLNSYKTFLKPSGVIHLKTDSAELYNFTNELIKYNDLDLFASTPDLYASPSGEDTTNIVTHYEQIFINQGKKITYTSFGLSRKDKITWKGEINE